MPAPTACQTVKYPAAIAAKDVGERLVLRNIGTADGSIMAAIMANHISWKSAAELNQE